MQVYSLDPVTRDIVAKGLFQLISLVPATRLRQPGTNLFNDSTHRLSINV
jgi:hypothetical protein